MDQPLEADDACAIKAYTTLASIIDDTSTDDLQQQKGLSDLRIHIPDVVCLVGCRSVSPYDKKSSNEWSKKWLPDGLGAARLGNARYQLFGRGWMPKKKLNPGVRARKREPSAAHNGVFHGDEQSAA